MLHALVKRVALVAGFFLSVGCGSSGNGNHLSQPTPVVRVWECFERALDLPVEAENPFDASQVSVAVTFVAPDGNQRTIPAFVWRDYERTLVDHVERLTAQGGLKWRVRFTPTQAGIWNWRWELTSPQTRHTSGWSTFIATDPAPDHHGFLRVSGEDTRYLRFDDGGPYLAVGENLGWYDTRGTFAYDDWLSKLASQGATYVRLWMPSWAFGLEWTERDEQGDLADSSLGNYTSRLDRAWQLDQVLGRAEELGIYVMLCIQNHGAFSVEYNSEWTDNPYNAANGGPLLRPQEFFTNGYAKELFKRRLRYIVARWGYSSHILAWELWNEVDLAEQPTLPQLVEWHAEMADTLRSLDPYGHLITTSLSETPAIIDFLFGTSLHAPLWNLPQIDLVQLHLYSIGEIGIDFAALFPPMVEMLHSYGRPVLVAEAGGDFRGPAETRKADPESAGFHDMLWSGIFSEAFGTGMTWWWDNVIDPEDLYGHFAPISTFVDGVAFDQEHFVSGGAGASAPQKPLDSYGLCGDTVALVWIKNAAHQWFHPDPSVVENAVVRCKGLDDGTWTGWWIDPYTGERSSEVSVLTGEGTLELPAPAFSRDVALRLERSP